MSTGRNKKNADDQAKEKIVCSHHVLKFKACSFWAPDGSEGMLIALKVTSIPTKLFLTKTLKAEAAEAKY
jgi:hypothetical protein